MSLRIFRLWKSNWMSKIKFYPRFDRVAAVDVVVREDDESGVGAHHQQASNPKNVPPEGPTE